MGAEYDPIARHLRSNVWTGIQFNLATSRPAKEGFMTWNPDDGTLNLGMPGGNVNLQMGQEMLIRVKNSSGADMTNGQLIYVSGASGNKPEITLAKADIEATSAGTLAMLTEDIADGQFGYVTSAGMVRDINLAPGTYTEGEILYLSATTAGAYTNAKPASPNHAVVVGTVINAHASEGIAFIRIINGNEFYELHDVDDALSSPTDKLMLAWNDSNSLWEQTPNVGYNFSTGNLEIGGTDIDDIYVNVTGDTMTGDLIMGGASDINFRDSNVVLTSAAQGILRINARDWMTFQVDGRDFMDSLGGQIIWGNSSDSLVIRGSQITFEDDVDIDGNLVVNDGNISIIDSATYSNGLGTSPYRLILSSVGGSGSQDAPAIEFRCVSNATVEWDGNNGRWNWIGGGFGLDEGATIFWSASALGVITMQDDGSADDGLQLGGREGIHLNTAQHVFIGGDSIPLKLGDNQDAWTYFNGRDYNIYPQFQNNAETNIVSNLNVGNNVGSNPELVTNGDFTGGDTGWTLGVGWEVVGGKLLKNANGVETATQALTGLTIGELYLISYDHDAIQSANHYITITIAGGGANFKYEDKFIGSQFFVFRALDTTQTITLTPSPTSSNNRHTFDNFSVKLIDRGDLRVGDIDASGDVNVSGTYSGGGFGADEILFSDGTDILSDSRFKWTASTGILGVTGRQFNLADSQTAFNVWTTGLTPIFTVDTTTPRVDVSNADFFADKVSVSTSSTAEDLNVGDQILFNADGTVPVLLGHVTGLTQFPGIWAGADATNPTTSNYRFLVVGDETIFNAPSGGFTTFSVNNESAITLHHSTKEIRMNPGRKDWDTVFYDNTGASGPGVEFARFDVGNKRLGILTGSPNYTLQVGSDTGSSTNYLGVSNLGGLDVAFAGAPITGYNFAAFRSDGTLGSPTAATVGRKVFEFIGSNHDNTAYREVGRFGLKTEGSTIKGQWFFDATEHGGGSNSFTVGVDSGTIFNAGFGDFDTIINDDIGELARFDSGDRIVVIGGGVGSEKLSVIGNILMTSSEADNTNKVSQLVSMSYDSDEENVSMLDATMTSGQNTIRWGGGNVSFNAATQHDFYTSTINGLLGSTKFRIQEGNNIHNPGFLDHDLIIRGGGTEIATFDGGTNNLEFPDDRKITFGDSNDYAIYYNPSLGGLVFKDNVGSNGTFLYGNTNTDRASTFELTGSGNFGVWRWAADSDRYEFDDDVKISGAYILPTADGNTDDIIKTDGAGNSSFATPTTDIPIAITMYDAEPARGSETNWNGGLLALATAQPLDSVPTDIVVTKGIGKILIVVNAGSDLAGDITITGTSVDRDTGNTTPADTDTITVDALTTDNTTTDANGNTVHGFAGAYISSKWFEGTVTLSTVDLTLTDVDVYHISFEQFNDSPNIVLDTLDANIFTTNVNAEFDAYLYDLHINGGDKCTIENHASVHVGAVGMPALANRYERLRRGNINEPLDGTTDGIWVDVHYSNSPAYVEDVTIKIWATKTQSLTLS